MKTTYWTQPSHGTTSNYLEKDKNINVTPFMVGEDILVAITKPRGILEMTIWKKDDILILRGVKNNGKPLAVYSGLTPNHIEIAKVMNCKSP